MSTFGEQARLPELEAVAWRRPVDERWLWWREVVSAGYTFVYCTPFIVLGVALVLLEPLLFPVSLISFLHAWVIPELFAYRGARVVLPAAPPKSLRAEGVAQGLLADLLDHDPRALQRDTGLALERGSLGTWLVAQSGALLVRARGRRTHCFCVRALDSELPPSDRIAHLLLALRQDEIGFATVANHAFAGATWRIKRRIPRPMRVALAAAKALEAGGQLVERDPAAARGRRTEAAV
jgi:hypothetical protein